MLTTNENGEREVTFLGLFVLALFLSLILVFMQWLLQLNAGQPVAPRRLRSRCVADK